MQSRHTETERSLSGTKLVCFDFDQTITNGHFYRYMYALPRSSSLFSASAQEIATELIRVQGIKNQTKLVEVINKLATDGHRIAIVTFNPLVDVIKQTLLQIGLSQEVVDRIYIDGELPSSDSNRKNRHLERVIRHYSIEGNSSVCLVDDDELNLSAAKELGIYTISVPMHSPFESHLDAVLTFIERQRDESVQQPVAAAAAAPLPHESPYARVISTIAHQELQTRIVQFPFERIRSLGSWNRYTETVLQQLRGVISMNAERMEIQVPCSTNKITIPILGTTTDEIRFKKQSLSGFFAELLGDRSVDYRKGQPCIDISF